MAQVKYNQIQSIDFVLSQWWDVKGLPWDFLQQAEQVLTAIAASAATLEKMKKKLVDDNVLRDADNNPVAAPDGAPDFGPNKDTVDAEWAHIMDLTFDCPSIPAQMLQDNAEKLSLTLGTMRMIKPLVAQE